MRKKPAKELLSYRIWVNVTQDEAKVLKKCARKESTSMSDYIRSILVRYEIIMQMSANLEE